LASVNTVQITVIETGTGDSLRGLFNTYGILEGADITISLLPQGEAYADRIKVFTGKIDHTSWNTGLDGGVGQLIAVDTSLGANPLVPLQPVTLATHPYAAPQALGQFIPLVYGGLNSLAYLPAVLVNATTGLYHLAGHPLDALASYFAVPAGGATWSHVGDVTATASDASLLLSAPLSQLIFGPGTPTTTGILTSTNVTNASNVLDGNAATVATLTPSTTSADGEGTSVLGVRATWATTDVALNRLDVVVYGVKRGDPLALTSIGRLVVNTIDAGAYTVLQASVAGDGPYSWGTNARTFALSFPGLAFGGGVGIECRFEVINEGGTGGADEAWAIGEIVFYGIFQVPNDLYPVFAGPYGSAGREDADGHITGSAGAPISKAAEVVQSVLEAWLGLTIDSTSFTSAKTLATWDATPWTFAFGIGAGWTQPQIQGSVLLDALARQSHSYLFPSGAGTWKMVPLVLAPTSRYSFTVSTMDHVQIETSRMEFVYNSYLVRYNWSPVTQQYQSAVYANAGGCSHSDATIASALTVLCSDSYDRYGVLPPLQVDAWAITDTSSAEDLLEKLVRGHWSQSFLVTWDSPFVAIHLEVGDGVTITHAELPTAVSGTIFTVLRVTLRPEDGDGASFPVQLVARSQPQ
jgi:hypothetical protein